MICKKCGALIEDDAAECKFCGMQYKDEEAAAEVSESEIDDLNETEENEETDFDEVEELLDENEIKRRKQMERMQQEKKEQLDEIENRRNQKKKRQRRNKVLIILGILVAVAGGVSAGLYIYKNTDKAVVTEVTPVPTVEAPTVMPTVMPSPSPSPIPSPSAAPANGTSGSSSTGGGSGSASWRPTGGSSSSRSSSSSSGSSSSSKGSSSASTSGSSSGGSSSSGSSSSSKPQTSTAATGGVYSAPGGFSNGKFNAALITGGEVIDTGSKKYMTFTYEGTTYYANVDKGSYTEYIKGKPFTIKAFPTSEYYNGHVVYEITSITNYNGSYIFPTSGYKALTEADLKGKTAKELALGRNEIYARHGRTFKTKEYQEYFNSCSWYSPNPAYDYSDDSSNLNSIEKANVKLIKEYEDKLN